MQDLHKIENRFAIYCSFILNPDTIIKNIDEMRQSEDPNQVERALLIYKIISEYFQSASKFTNDISKLDMDDKMIRIATMVGTIISDEHSPKFVVAARKYSQLQKIYSSPDDNFIIKTDAEKPIPHADLVFLNQLAAQTESTPAEVGKLNLFNDRTFKSRIKHLYHSHPYYFEQAFCNVDVLIQEKILGILDTEEEQHERKRNPKKGESFRFLEELFIVSTIDKKMLKSDVKFTKDKAFETFNRVLQSKDKVKTVSILLNDESIMRAIFNYKYNNRDSLSTLRHLFVDTRYPYNDMLLKCYAKIQNRTEDGLDKDLQEMGTDQHFADAYLKYRRSKDLEDMKKKAEILVIELEDAKPEEKLLEEIVEVIGFFGTYTDPIPEMLSAFDVQNMMTHIYEYMVKHALYKNDALNQAIDAYFSTRIYNEFYMSSYKSRNINQAADMNKIIPGDMWYEVNRLLYIFEVKSINKVYLKYPSTTYEFIPFGNVEVSSRTLLRSDMQNFPDDTIGMDISFERIKSVDLYLYRIYQKAFERIIKSIVHIDITEEIESKGFFKKAPEERQPSNIYTDEAERIFTILIDYTTVAFLIQKNQEIFLDQYKVVVPDLLRSLYTFKKSYKVIQDKVIISEKTQLLQLFNAQREVIEQLHKDVKTYGDNRFTKGLIESTERFLGLVSALF